MTEDSSTTDTIVAISTPPGRGGIGIVRLSGPAALEIAGRLVPMDAAAGACEGAAGQGGRPGRVGGWGQIEDGDRTIDDAVVTAFLEGRSYTGETVVEIAAHGSPVVLEAMVRGALAEGAGWGWRCGWPGQGSLRSGRFWQGGSI